MKHFILCFFFSGILLQTGCSTLPRSTAMNIIPTETPLHQNDNRNPAPPMQNTDTEAPLQNLPASEKSTTSFDQALDFYEASDAFSKSGEFDAALEALDQAYDIIMRTETLSPSDLQQRDDIRLTIARRILEIHSSRTMGTEGKQSAIQIPDNIYVQQEIKRFTQKERTFFVRAYRRSGIYMEMILEKLRSSGLPEELAWLPLIESGYEVKALSSARALGLWQFIPSTGVRFGLRRDLLIDERMDPEKATDAAIAYLTELHNLFGDWPTVLAAYNCGEGRVLRTIRSQNVNYLDNFWDLYTKLPRETAQYVPRFLATIHILQNMEKYGFDPADLAPPPEYEKVSVERQVSLQSIAEATKIPLEDLLRLNPELRYALLPPEAYTLKIPQGYTDHFLASIESIAESSPPQKAYLHHRIKPGESLSNIAERYKVPVRQIMQENNIKSAHRIRAGHVIKIPGRNSQGIAVLRPNSTDPKECLTYTVRQGDTLWAIANRFKTSTHILISANQLSGSTLRIGQKLRIPGGAQQVKTLSTQRQSYKVQTGDTPFTIALRHNISLNRLLEMNKLKTESTIYPGQKLFLE